MERRRHIERFVILVRARERQIAGTRVGADKREYIRDARTAEAADDVPSFDAYMPGVLPNPGQGANLLERVGAGIRDQAVHSQPPGAEVDAGIVACVAVEREPFGSDDFGVCEGRRQVRTPEPAGRGPVGECQAAPE